MTSTVITKDKEILGGTPVFKGTRVPVQNLFDYIEGGNTIEQFLKGFPSVSKQQVIEVLKTAESLVVSE